MIKEQLYSEKFTLLESWLDPIFASVKKDLRNEYLRKNSQFASKYFRKTPLNKITIKELQEACYNEILHGNEELGEWIVARWMFKHAEIYQFFAVELSKINPDFEKIEEIPEEMAQALVGQAILRFGAAQTYIFSIFNAVSFSQKALEAIKQEALLISVKKEQAPQALSIEELQEKHDREIAKLTEKYELRMQGMQRKYIDDTQGFKRQIAQLQRRLQDAGRS